MECDGVSARQAGWAAVSAAFGSLGRVFITLGEDFRVRHVSESANAMAGAGSDARMTGLPVEEVLGAELFGPGGVLRRALLAGERREGWRASLRIEPAGSRLVSVTVAPLQHDASGVCDPEVRYLVVLRPAEEDASTGPTAFGGVIARSRAMAQVLQLVQNLEHSEVTVLITGESGTGKEVVAQALHRHSPRRDGPFVAVNCGAIPADLLESELFGHVRGAFTGAVKDRVGRFEAADKGTLFLDEVGELPPHLQVKLLRVLQEHTYQRVGESTDRTSHARIIAATNSDLETAVHQGHFRDDLFYRLRVVPIELPPLRQRPEDVEPLARHLLARIANRNGRVLGLSPEAMRALLSHSWPGNVRELENALEYATAVCKGQVIFPEDLPTTVAARRTSTGAPRAGLSDMDAEAVRCVLEENRWSRSAAARALGVSRTTLWRRMRELRLIG
ncbi:MAG TPA: sigma 54-interacting transcriptional regulator [Myxococcales bacterium]|nr:sigma 54-interacting transcriptional regulator [Myxococcales bacterium]